MITIVYDNQLHDKTLRSGWGFSCLIEQSNKKILFDTGDNLEKLSFNLSNLQINPRDFEAIVLSHNHWDHTGGLQTVLGKNRNCKLYFGKSYPASFQERLKSQSVDYVLVEDIRSIAEGIFVGPEMGGFGLREVPLTLQTDKGLVIITGCAHPGILKIVEKVKQELGKNIYLVLGGFHLGMSLGLKSIVKGLREIRVEKVAPCHCTGDRAVNLFQEKFKENFIKVGAGLKIEI
ncbi:MAG: MBL fold metallo-hydrolase [Candidatus Omnitrophica bacterium]|nr:MBL fold metallo-hydrolase [Candidatus Omnitrophota bacterium]